MTLRPYQEAAVRAAVAALRVHRSTLLVLPTGTGKTQIFVALAGMARGRTLILAHRDELVSQAVGRVEQMLGGAKTVGVEKASDRASREAGIVVGGVQTMRGERLSSWPVDHFSLVIIDEAHHAPAKSYRDIIDHFAGAKVVGVTATPDRTDAVAMGTVFDDVAYRYDIEKAVEDGWLVMPTMRRVILESVDLSGIHTRAGDLAANELEGEIGSESSLQEIAHTIELYSGNRLTLAYTPGVASAHRLAGILGPVARAVDGETETELRRATLAAHAKGDFRVLVNCMVLTEGYDSPAVSCVAVARPTKSRSLYTQMVGRGLRPSPGKTDCLILDYGGCSKRLDLVGPEDVLGGKESAEVLAEAKKLADDEGERGVREILFEARKIVGHRVEEAEAFRRRTGHIATARRLVPARLAIDLIGADMPLPIGDRATTYEISKLEKFGVDGEGLLSNEADAMYRVLIGRIRSGLASVKQLALLTRLRESPHSGMSFESASALIDSLIGNRRAR